MGIKLTIGQKRLIEERGKNPDAFCKLSRTEFTKALIHLKAKKRRLRESQGDKITRRRELIREHGFAPGVKVRFKSGSYKYKKSYTIRDIDKATGMVLLHDVKDPVPPISLLRTLAHPS